MAATDTLPVQATNSTMTASSSVNPQTAEVMEVKDAFPGRCRIIQDVGMFAHVVTLQPKDMDVTLKFQLTGK